MFTYDPAAAIIRILAMHMALSERLQKEAISFRSYSERPRRILRYIPFSSYGPCRIHVGGGRLATINASSRFSWLVIQNLGLCDLRSGVAPAVRQPALAPPVQPGSLAQTLCREIYERTDFRCGPASLDMDQMDR